MKAAGFFWFFCFFFNIACKASPSFFREFPMLIYAVLIYAVLIQPNSIQIQRWDSLGGAV